MQKTFELSNQLIVRNSKNCNMKKNRKESNDYSLFNYLKLIKVLAYVCALFSRCAQREKT